MHRALSIVLNVLIAVFMLLGTALVLVQLVGAVTLQAPAIAWAVAALGKPAYFVAAAAGMLAFGLEYAKNGGRATE